MKKDPLNRFLDKAQIGPLPVEWTGKPEDRTECLLWTASCNKKGYGRFRVKNKTLLAHRWIYEQCIGLIPEKLQLDHLCRVRNCVNPLHLEAVTNKENSYRSPIQKNIARNFGLKKRKFKLPEGVTIHGRKFKVQKRINGKTIYLGVCSDLEEASKIYQDFIKNELHR